MTSVRPKAGAEGKENASVTVVGKKVKLAARAASVTVLATKDRRPLHPLSAKRRELREIREIYV